MTKIPLTDAIWSRLYGPYGARDVAATLADLSDGWDESIASELYWNRLHHQDDIYPVTFAALHWLWEVTPASENGKIERLYFFSHVMACAFRSAPFRAQVDGSKRDLNGLSLRAKDHHRHWIAPEFWLTETDMSRLAELRDWLMSNAQVIAEECVRHCQLENPAYAGYLLEGPFTIAGHEAIANASIMWSEGYEITEIVAECGPIVLDDAKAAKLMAKRISPINASFGQFLKVLAAQTTA